MSSPEKFEFWNLTLIDQTLTFARVRLKKDVIIVFYAQYTRTTCIVRHSWDIFFVITHNLTLWPWPLLRIRPILICYFLHALRSLLPNFGFAAVIPGGGRLPSGGQPEAASVPVDDVHQVWSTSALGDGGWRMERTNGRIDLAPCAAAEVVRAFSNGPPQVNKSSLFCFLYWEDTKFWTC